MSVPEKQNQNGNVHILEFFEIDVIFVTGANELLLNGVLTGASERKMRNAGRLRGKCGAPSIL